jgi:hypothetical protein
MLIETNDVVVVKEDFKPEDNFYAVVIGLQRGVYVYPITGIAYDTLEEFTLHVHEIIWLATSVAEHHKLEYRYLDTVEAGQLEHDIHQKQ